jgi:hypothetical protein
VAIEIGERLHDRNAALFSRRAKSRSMRPGELVFDEELKKRGLART